MKNIYFATGNESKGKRFAAGLAKKNIKIFTLKDLNLKLDVLENGQSPIENARIKARELYRLISEPVLGMDDTLYLEGVPEDKQPGLFVRRVNGRSLTDEEMIDHYVNLVKEYGINGKINAKWIYGMVVINEKGEEREYTWEKADFYMTDEVSNIINPGYPLNSISRLKDTNKYLSELTTEDKEKLKNNEDNVIDFITNALN